MADICDDIVCPVIVPQCIGCSSDVLDATWASCLMVCELHPESTSANCGRITGGNVSVCVESK